MQTDDNKRNLLKAGLATATVGAAAILGGCATAGTQKSRSRTYVLIHGAWHGGWVWKDIATALRRMGHEVYAPSLTGLGDRRHLLRPGINLDTHADDITNLIELEGLNDIVLVGWSYGGMVASDVLARVPSKVAAMVYLDAFVPERGKSLADYAGPPAASFRQAAAAGRDIAPIPLSVFGVTDPAVISHVTPRISLQPSQTFVQASKALSERPRIPHTYVRASNFPSPGFDEFFKQFETAPMSKAFNLKTSHLLMFTDPASTLRILSEAA